MANGREDSQCRLGEAAGGEGEDGQQDYAQGQKNPARTSVARRQCAGNKHSVLVPRA